MLQIKVKIYLCYRIICISLHHQTKTKDMKTVNVYGVEMTSIQEMMFSKYRDSKGISMNTYSPDERKRITEEWLSNNY